MNIFKPATIQEASRRHDQSYKLMLLDSINTRIQFLKAGGISISYNEAKNLVINEMAEGMAIRMEGPDNKQAVDKYTKQFKQSLNEILQRRMKE